MPASPLLQRVDLDSARSQVARVDLPVIRRRTGDQLRWRAHELGASNPADDVVNAMNAAAEAFVDLDELAEAAGSRLAALTGAEWGIVTSGSTGGLALATAACLAGNVDARRIKSVCYKRTGAQWLIKGREALCLGRCRIGLAPATGGSLHRGAKA